MILVTLAGSSFSCSFWANSICPVVFSISTAAREVSGRSTAPACTGSTAGMHSAASSVASEPKTTSKMPAALSRFAIAQPANSPHAVQGIKNGKMHSTSETRHWIAP